MRNSIRRLPSGNKKMICHEDKNLIQLDIKAVPGASKTEFAGIKDGRLRIRVAAAPEDGKANAEMLIFLAKALGCPQRDLKILSGEKSRLKTIAMPSACKEKLKNILEKSN
jgi:uncharacterized protein (TIGR00251 family)